MKTKTIKIRIPIETKEDLQFFEDALAGASSDEHPLKGMIIEDTEDDFEFDDDDFIDKTNYENYEVSIIEFAVYNSFLGKCMHKTVEGFKVLNYGKIEDLEKIMFGGIFKTYLPFWYQVKITAIKNKTINAIFQTRIYMNSAGRVCCELNFSYENQIEQEIADEIYKKFHKTAFNKSEYRGKCLEVNVHHGSFEGIKIIDTKDFNCELILTKTQKKFLSHFENRISKGGNARYLLNGEPGTGKTESIRNIIKKLTPNATFIIPDFETPDDLKTILEACEIFDPGVIVIDDLDLMLGSRDKHTATKHLGDFLQFFDGVKKRRISLLASTNNKELVDHAAERPGRFNIVLDFTYLNDKQVKKVIDLHFPKKLLFPELYEVLTGNDKQGMPVKVTGAFISNLAENVVEMTKDDPKWSEEDTLFLIRESYAGFYSSQLSRQRRVGFKSDLEEDEE